jgi:large subunit ribosomal protein L24
MPTKAEIKAAGKPVKMKIRRGDKVLIIAGKDKGQIGYVYAASPKEQKVIVARRSEENREQIVPLNAAVKHHKARTQGDRSGRRVIPVPIHVSNVMLLDPETNEPTRVGRRRNEDGKIERYSKKTSKTIAEPPAEFDTP